MQFILRPVLMICFCGTLLTASGVSQTTSAPPSLPKIVKGSNGRFALFVDGAPYLILGGQVHNSSGWPAALPGAWTAGHAMNANTLEVPIYWDQFEPQPGKFDYSVLDVLLKQAREHNFHLVLLWFGTWKNGNMSYTPDWIKRDPAHYPRAQDANGLPLNSLSAVSASNLDADRTAFSTLMGHLRTIDSIHTVLMVQVENEAGIYRSSRDYSPEAQALFKSQVPSTLINSLHRPPGTWEQVFGTEADEAFESWSIAHYIEKVAQAGKAQYPLPLYVNAALKDPMPAEPNLYNLDIGHPDVFEYGGPTDIVLDIWKAATPSIDIVAPDNYFTDYPRYVKVLDEYGRPDNPLMVPETGGGPESARYLFAVVGHGGIAFSPFGIDSNTNSELSAIGIKGFVHPVVLPEHVPESAELPSMYALFASMDREIALWNFEGKLQAVAEDPRTDTQILKFGKWNVIVDYNLPSYWYGPRRHNDTGPRGCALVAQLSENSFLVTGFHVRVDFKVADPASKQQRQFLNVEEGNYSSGHWQPIRQLNGDETDFGLNYSAVPGVLKITLGTY